MITSVSIRNYKSIKSLSFDIGRITVLIGANGSGKSNILEAIALGSAAAIDKLDNEFLNSRGIRITNDSRLMKSAFEKESAEKPIIVTFENKQKIAFEFELHKASNDTYAPWIDTGAKLDPLFGNIEHAVKEFLRKEHLYNDDLARDIRSGLVKKRSRSQKFGQYLIYSPEIGSLRRFENEGQIEPLGRKGEGLFKLLRVLNTEDKTALAEIKECLRIFDWFEDFVIPKNLSPEERRLQIRDRYLDSSIKYFDQQSTNEGFLYVLFYFCLFASRKTPSFFAVDNIDASLNPKLCKQLMITLFDLAKQHNKRVILTTHNPALLDGLDLGDKNQILYAVNRNKAGETNMTRIFKPKPLKGKDPVPLSESFLRGYLGGLPRNF